MSAVAKPYLSEIDYLVLERKAPTKSEYYKGEVFAMSGASKEHNKIVAGTIVEIGQHLKGKKCSIMTRDTRVCNPLNTLFTYPDVVVTCEEEEYLDTEFDTLLNPTIIIEVLSKSTKSYDRKSKFAEYKTLDSFQEYILIDQNKCYIETYFKEKPNSWLGTDYKDITNTIYLKSLDCSIEIADIYDNIVLKK